MGFFERETVLELLRPTAVIGTIYLIEHFGTDHTAKTIAGILAILLLAMFDYLLRKGAHFRPLRRRWYPLSRLEGVWLQRVDNARPYSIACIKYEANGRWRYYGIAYDRDFNPAARWSTTSIIHSKSTNAWHFAGDAEMLQFNQSMKKYVGLNRGYVVPILDLPDHETWAKADCLDGKVIDLKVDQKDDVFGVTLYRANPDKLRGNGKLPLRDDIQKLSAAEVEQILVDANVPMVDKPA